MRPGTPCLTPRPPAGRGPPPAVLVRSLGWARSHTTGYSSCTTTAVCNCLPSHVQAKHSHLSRSSVGKHMHAILELPIQAEPIISVPVPVPVPHLHRSLQEHGERSRDPQRSPAGLTAGPAETRRTSGCARACQRSRAWLFSSIDGVHAILPITFLCGQAAPPAHSTGCCPLDRRAQAVAPATRGPYKNLRRLICGVCIKRALA
jgi:hypothetical protein